MFKRLLLQFLSNTRNYSHSITATNKIKPKEETKKNLTAVLNNVEEIVLEERPIPKVKQGEVLIAIDCVGISNSDLQYWKFGKLGPYKLCEPMVIGHEASGVVAEIGANVDTLCPGDRVVIEPGLPCRKCDFCKSGRYNLCSKMRFCATPPVDGNLTCYYKHAADFCYKLPDHVSMEEGALISTLAMGSAACRRANLKTGMNLLILGAGSIGLATLMMAQSLGVYSIMIIDTNLQRLHLAEELGATLTLHMRPNEKIEQLAKRIEANFDCMPECTIDCCGTINSAQLGMLVTRSGGVLTLAVMTNDFVKLSLINALAREVDLVCVFRFCDDYAHALAITASGRVKLGCLVTQHYMIEHTARAFRMASENAPDTVKVLIHVQPRDTNNLKPFKQ